MNILIVSEYFYPHFGGVEQVFFEVGKRLAAQNHTVTVFTTQEPDINIDERLSLKKKMWGGLISFFEVEGITVVRLRVPNIFRRYLFAIMGFPCILVLFPRVDLIHSSSNYTIAITCFMAAKILGKPVTMSVWEIWHTLWFSFYSPIIGFCFWVYEKLIISFPFDFFITPSKFVYGQIPRILPEKKIAIPLAGKKLRFDKTSAQNLRSKYRLKSTFVFLYYGRFGKSKGVEILIRSFPKVSKRCRNCRLLLFISNLSEGNKKILTSLIQKYTIGSVVEIHPHIPEQKLAAHLSLADCIVISDRTISFGLAALEASYIGRPIVTTTGGALPEVAYGKVIFVKPGSDEALADGMIDAIKGRFKKIPKKNFSWDKTSQEYERIFQKVTDSLQRK